MKHKLLLVFSIFACVAIPSGSALAERIVDFNTTLTITEDARVMVSEEITYDFGENDRHGIFRDIPLTHPQKASSFLKERYIEVTPLTVLRNGEDEPFEFTAEKKKVQFKIGDAASTVRGIHTYTVVYTVSGALSYFPDGTSELYWNATGNNWRVPIERSFITIRSIEDVFADQQACYRGTYGSNDGCTTHAAGGSLSVFSVENLKSYEGVSVAQLFKKDALPVLILERYSILIFSFVVIPTWFVFVSILVYRYVTRYKSDRPRIVQYEPLPDILPMYTGVLYDGSLDPHDMTAGIVYLAREGYLRISRVEAKVFFIFEVDDYAIELRKDSTEGTTLFQRELIALLFSTRAKVGDTVRLSTLKKSISKQKENAKIITRLEKAVASDLKEKGYYEGVVYIQALWGGVFFIVWATLFFSGFLSTLISESLHALSILTVLVVMGTLFIIALGFRRRTKKGYDALWHLEGFKEYLNVTGKERFRFHNAPHKNPQEFLEYLPYAIAFGVEKEWAEVFSDVTIPSPGWYDDAGAAGSFSALGITESLGAFSSSFTQSSGSSGSSGGGFSGGGGGGGGGGSW